jgi:spore coat polysaccharide biosynthesis protein SpsF (cytidylyltransferase family)
MGSTRLRGKVLATIAGRPMVTHCLERVMAARSVDQVVLAIPVNRADDELATTAFGLGAEVVRGPEADVLGRFVKAAAATHAEVIVRITADCPLVDPRLVDRVVWTLLRDGSDYASNVAPPTYPDGYDVEALTRACLIRLNKEATKAYEREHVTARAREHPELFRHSLIRCRRDLSNLRLVVDTDEDLDRMERLLRHFPELSRPGLGAVLATLVVDKELAAASVSAERDSKYIAEREAARFG